MKIFNQIKSGFAKVALAVLLASPLAVSCYDDSALQEQIDMIVDQLFELEQKMNSEIDAYRSGFHLECVKRCCHRCNNYHPVRWY